MKDRWEPVNGVFSNTPHEQTWPFLTTTTCWLVLTVIVSAIIIFTFMIRPPKKWPDTSRLWTVGGALAVGGGALIFLTIELLDLEALTKIANIVFWFTTLIIAALTYRQAKRTLFAPIKTETFKVQLKAFEEIFLYFQNKNEHDFINDLDFEEMLALNAFTMVDSYTQTFFGRTINLDETRKAREKGFSNQAHQRNDQNVFAIEAGAPDLHNQIIEMMQQPTQADWINYALPYFRYTQKYVDQLKQIDRLTASPVIPKDIRKLIVEFRTAAHASVNLIDDCIIQSAQKMPECYPSIHSLQRFQSFWISNLFNNSKPQLEPLAKNIMNEISLYLKIETLTEK
ncbi:hypothetical protein [Pseudomonas putida]|uniref:hypothetical protein n=1 Tax=Pseudomonas putida TaxID=303 RepID=UPI0011A8D8D5|nr:hypothetical protein [Pseudomonas putida]